MAKFIEGNIIVHKNSKTNYYTIFTVKKSQKKDHCDDCILKSSTIGNGFINCTERKQYLLGIKGPCHLSWNESILEDGYNFQLLHGGI